ncbi:hypothetical protein PMIN05_003795 [Paraphaeosphaeria minitans]
MALWLKDLAARYNAYTVGQINVIPTGAQGVSVVAALVATSLCMIYPLWTVFSVVQAIFLFANICLLVWDIPKGLHFASYYLLGVSAAVTPILMPFINVALRDDAEARAVTIGAMMTSGWAIYSFYPVVVFPQVEAPKWRKGYSVNIAFVFGCWSFFMLSQWLYGVDKKKKERQAVERDARDDEEVLSAKGAGDVVKHVEERKSE